MPSYFVWPKRHPYLTGTLLMILVGIGYWYTSKPVSQPIRYVLAPVTRGTLITTVQGSGQVLGQHQLELKPNVSGIITHVYVTTGQAVSSSAPLFEIDKTVAQKAVRDTAQAVADAKISLDSAQLSLAKLENGATAYELQQAQNDIATQEQSVRLSSDGTTPVSIRHEYDSAVPLIKSTAQTLEQSLYDADQILGIDSTNANDAYERLLSVLNSGILAQAVTRYPSVKASVHACKTESDRLASMNEPTANIDTALTNIQTCLSVMSPFLESVYNSLLNTITSPTFTQSQLSSLESTIQSDRTNISSKLTAVITEVQALEQVRASYESSLLSLKKLKDSYEHLKQGSDPTDIALAQNSLETRRSALVSAQNKYMDALRALADYTIRAPFDGIVAKVSAQTADSASPGTSLATILTPTQLAQLSVNEVDAATIHTGQKATITFDAIPDLTIAGRVVTIDPLGTVTQGVVSYAVQVAFDSQDTRVKSGMTTNISILTNIRPDVLLIANSAIHASGSNSSVQTITGTELTASSTRDGITSATPPSSKIVQVGLSNETETEILGGVQEGEAIVVRTVDPNATTATTPASSQLRIPGLGGIGSSGQRGGVMSR